MMQYFLPEKSNNFSKPERETLKSMDTEENLVNGIISSRTIRLPRHEISIVEKNSS